jgi:hypothetical protein
LGQSASQDGREAVKSTARPSHKRLRQNGGGEEVMTPTHPPTVLYSIQ